MKNQIIDLKMLQRNKTKSALKILCSGIQIIFYFIDGFCLFFSPMLLPVFWIWIFGEDSILSKVFSVFAIIAFFWNMGKATRVVDAPLDRAQKSIKENKESQHYHRKAICILKRYNRLGYLDKADDAYFINFFMDNYYNTKIDMDINDLSYIKGFPYITEMNTKL